MLPSARRMLHSQFRIYTPLAVFPEPEKQAGPWKNLSSNLLGSYNNAKQLFGVSKPPSMMNRPTAAAPLSNAPTPLGNAPTNITPLMGSAPPRPAPASSTSAMDMNFPDVEDWLKMDSAGKWLADPPVRPTTPSLSPVLPGSPAAATAAFRGAVPAGAPSVSAVPGAAGAGGGAVPPAGGAIPPAGGAVPPAGGPGLWDRLKGMNSAIPWYGRMAVGGGAAGAANAASSLAQGEAIDPMGLAATTVGGALMPGFVPGAGVLGSAAMGAGAQLPYEAGRTGKTYKMLDAYQQQAQGMEPLVNMANDPALHKTLGQFSGADPSTFMQNGKLNPTEMAEAWTKAKPKIEQLTAQGANPMAALSGGLQSLGLQPWQIGALLLALLAGGGGMMSGNSGLGTAGLMLGGLGLLGPGILPKEWQQSMNAPFQSRPATVPQAAG